MPVDIASGKVELDFADVSIPGKVDLTWDRHYGTDLLDRPPSMLGRGWTTRYCATLARKREGFEFVTPEGTSEFFSDPEGLVERGGRVTNFGSFLEKTGIFPYVFFFKRSKCEPIHSHFELDTKPNDPGLYS